MKDHRKSLKKIISSEDYLILAIPDELPVRQSEDLTYKLAAEKIIESGNAYWCDCSKSA